MVFISSPPFRDSLVPNRIPFPNEGQRICHYVREVLFPDDLTEDWKKISPLTVCYRIN